MYGDLSRKIYEVRKNAVSTIVDYMTDNSLETINCCEITSNSPMVTPTQSLDSIIFEHGVLSFFASGEIDNGFYFIDEVSTDLLVEIVGFIEDYDEDIKEYGKE